MESAIGVSASQFREARAALNGVALRTPLIDAPYLTTQVGVSVRLKPEYLQPIGAFKIRGAFTALARLSDADRQRGVITHSSGNHGQAVAMAAVHFGIRAVIVMPAGAPLIKVEGVRRHGAEIVFVEHPATERVSRTEEIIAQEGLTLIAPYEHPDVICGQGTIGLEIVEDAEDIVAIVAPIGGGGLLAGIAAAAHALRPSVQVVGAEPATAASFSAALAAGTPVPLEHTESIADGLLAREVGRVPFAILHSVVDTAITVSDEEIVSAMRVLYRTMGLRIEPSGAVGVAAILSGRWTPPGPTAIVVTGGNIDPILFRDLVTA